MKNIIKALKVISATFIIALTITMPVFASPNNQVTVYIEQFTPQGGWKPGDTKELDINIENKTSNKIQVETINVTTKLPEETTQQFEHKQENIKLIFKYKDEIISDSNITLKDMLETKKIVLNKRIDVGRSSNELITMDIIMDEKMDDRAQSLESIYSFEIGYRILSDGSGGGGIYPPEKPEKPDEPGDTEIPEKPDDPNNPDDSNNPGDTEKPEKPDDGNNSSGTNKPDTDLGGSTDKLPQTGGMINGASLGLLGISLVAGGIVIDKKSSNKGGKADE